jgi:hypothetical protein
MDPTSWLKVKYGKAMWMCLGGAVHLGDNGELKGVVAKPFEYSDKIILSIPDYKKLMDTEKALVNILKQEGSDWFNDNWAPRAIYKEGPPKFLKILGKVTEEKLMALGIKSVGNIALLSDERINKISILSPKERISESKLKALHVHVVQSLSGPPPPKTTYQTMVNLCLAKDEKDE